MVKIEINNKIYKVKIADTEELKEEGLQNLKSMPKNEGMLFVYDEPQEVSFWMKDTYIPLDIIFIDEYGEVISICEGVPESEEPCTEHHVKYVLELNKNSGVEKGDDVDLSEVETEEDCEDDEEEEEEKDSDERIMKVLDEKGESQMDLKGGERIFSRANTRVLVKLSKRAYKSKSEKDYRTLGRKVFKYLDIQNNKEEDYVELPE